MTAQAIQTVVESAVQVAMQELNSQFGGEIQNLRSQVQALRSELEATQTSLNAVTVRLSNNRRPILPDPEKLSKPKTELEPWLAAMQGKLEVDNAALGDAKTKFYYVYGRLDTELQNLLDAQLQVAVTSQVFDHTQLFQALQRVFADPLKKQRAVKKLHSLRQGDLNFSSFFATWERLSWQADEAAKVHDSQRIAALRYALNTSLQRRLDYREMDESLPDTYDDFVKLLHRLASTSDSGTRAFSPNTHATPQKIRDPSAMDLSIAGVNTISFTGFQDIDSDSEDLPISSTTAAPTSTLAMRAQWQAEGCCRRCGHKDHIVRNCPYLPYTTSN